MILLWRLNDSKECEHAPVFQEDEDAQLNKESWSVFKTLRYGSFGTHNCAASHRAAEGHSQVADCSMGRQRFSLTYFG